MYCSHFGEKIAEGASFCAKCGNAVKKEEANNSVNTVTASTNTVVMKPAGSGAATASMVLGILAIVAGVITLFIAVGFSAYNTYSDFYSYVSSSYQTELVFAAIGVIFIPAVLAIIAFGLALGSRGKIKNGANTAGLVLSIITFVICILDYVMITG